VRSLSAKHPRQIPGFSAPSPCHFCYQLTLRTQHSCRHIFPKLKYFCNHRYFSSYSNESNFHGISRTKKHFNAFFATNFPVFLDARSTRICNNLLMSDLWAITGYSLRCPARSTALDPRDLPSPCPISAASALHFYRTPGHLSTFQLSPGLD
jgi:hypothetical protein